MKTDKVISLLGFALKAGKTVFGIDSIERYRKKKYLIFICKSMSEGSKEKLIRDNKDTPIIICRDSSLEGITHRQGLKALALTDRQMAEALLKNINESYQLVTEVK